MRLGAGQGSSGTNRLWELGVAVNTADLGDATGENHEFAVRDVSANATRLLVDWNTGNVGIGTTAPAATLDVAGTARLSTAGTPIAALLRSTQAIDPPSIAARTTATVTVSVPNAALGATVWVSPTDGAGGAGQCHDCVRPRVGGGYRGQWLQPPHQRGHQPGRTELLYHRRAVTEGVAAGQFPNFSHRTRSSCRAIWDTRRTYPSDVWVRSIPFHLLPLFRC